MELVLVKWGGSLITDKSEPWTSRPETIDRLCAELRSSLRDGLQVILGHGGGSFAHQPAREHETHRGLIRPDSALGFARVQDAAARLNRIVVGALIAHGLPAVSVSPSSAALAHSDRIADFAIGPLVALLQAGLLPVVYGDVTMDQAKGCSVLSTEEVLYHLAHALGGRRVLMVGKTDGVLTADPARDPAARPIREITEATFPAIRNCLAASDGIDVTGGMLLKVTQALLAAARGVETQILDGSVPGSLARALEGDRAIGTRINA